MNSRDFKSDKRFRYLVEVRSTKRLLIKRGKESNKFEWFVRRFNKFLKWDPSSKNSNSSLLSKPLYKGPI